MIICFFFCRELSFSERFCPAVFNQFHRWFYQERTYSHQAHPRCGDKRSIPQCKAIQVINGATYEFQLLYSISAKSCLHSDGFNQRKSLQKQACNNLAKCKILNSGYMFNITSAKVSAE